MTRKQLTKLSVTNARSGFGKTREREGEAGRLDGVADWRIVHPGCIRNIEAECASFTKLHRQKPLQVREGSIALSDTREGETKAAAAPPSAERHEGREGGDWKQDPHPFLVCSTLPELHK